MRRLLLVGAVGLWGLGLAGQRTSEVVRWTVQETTREAVVYAPGGAVGREGAPLVLAFHGYGDDIDNFQRIGLHAAWPEAVVVYLRGLEVRDGRRGWQVERRDEDPDLRLVDVALASIRQQYPIDEARIYATGFSNGGMFTYLLWAERAHVFAAYAPVAARVRASVRPDSPRPILHVAGEGDRVVPFTDQQRAMELAIAVNGVTGPGTPCGAGCTVHGSDAPAPVMTWIHRGAHVYPPGTTDRIVSFLREHRLDP